MHVSFRGSIFQSHGAYGNLRPQTFQSFFWENAKETAAPAKPTPKSQTKAMWNQSPRGFLAFYFWVMFFWVGGSSQSEYYARQFFG